MKHSAVYLNFALLGFIAYLTKIMIYPSTLSDGLVLAVVSAVFGLMYVFKLQEPIEVNEEMKERIDGLQKELQEVKEEVQEIKNAVSGVNMAKLKPGNKKYF